MASGWWCGVWVVWCVCCLLSGLCFVVCMTCGLFGVWVAFLRVCVVWCFCCLMCSLVCGLCGVCVVWCVGSLVFWLPGVFVLFGLWVVWCVWCVLCVLFGVLLCGVRVVYWSISDMFNICFEFLDVCYVQLEVEQS